MDKAETGQNKEKPIYFYGHTKGDYGCFSQFYPCQFTENGITYQCAEQYMMAGKAKTMGDSETLEKIMVAPSAQDAKKLGRSVTPYDNDKWSAVRFDVVKQGNLLKFGQNKPLLDILMSTENRPLVEASPSDTIWGIGISEKDAKRGMPWRGQNLLGKALMAVREELNLS